MANAPVVSDPQPSAETPPPATPTGKPDVAKRAVALIIDAVIAAVVGFVPLVGGIVATGYWLVRDGMDLDFMDHRSIGKKLLKLRPVTLDGAPVDITTSIKRNWMFALGGIAQLLVMTLIGIVIAIPLVLAAVVIGLIEIILVLTDAEGRRFGDKMAGTRVIETDA